MKIKDSLFPDFLVVGAAKSGTTSLDQYFRNHPDIYMPELIKELNYFHLKGQESNRAILKRIKYLPTNVLSYLGCFFNKKENQISGECSPSYLIYYNDTIKNIKEIHPNWQELKIIIILREPISKIWSHYRHVKKLGLDPADLSLEDCLENEKFRLNDPSLFIDIHFVENTSYYKQVKAYVDNFKNVKIVKYDELKSNPDILMNDLFGFLGCQTKNSIDVYEKHGKSTPVLKYRSVFFKKLDIILPNNLRKLLPDAIIRYFKVEEKMSNQVQKRLAAHFKIEIEKLNQITKNDFSDWLKIYDSILKK